MSWLIVLIAVGSSAWVYMDAQKLCARLNALGIQFKYSPLLAAGMTLVLWIVCFPLYLYQRQQVLKDLDDLDTTDPKKRLLPWLAFGVMLLVGAWGIWGGAPRLPNCSDKETLALLKTIVTEQVAGTNDPEILKRFQSQVTIELGAVQTLRYQEKPERYTCRAVVNVELSPGLIKKLTGGEEATAAASVMAMLWGPMLAPFEDLESTYMSEIAVDHGKQVQYVTSKLNHAGATGLASITESNK